MHPSFYILPLPLRNGTGDGTWMGRISGYYRARECLGIWIAKRIQIAFLRRGKLIGTVLPLIMLSDLFYAGVVPLRHRLDNLTSDGQRQGLQPRNIAEGKMDLHLPFNLLPVDQHVPWPDDPTA